MNELIEKIRRRSMMQFKERPFVYRKCGVLLCIVVAFYRLIVQYSLKKKTSLNKISINTIIEYHPKFLRGVYRIQLDTITFDVEMVAKYTSYKSNLLLI